MNGVRLPVGDLRVGLEGVPDETPQAVRVAGDSKTGIGIITAEKVSRTG